MNLRWTHEAEPRGYSVGETGDQQAAHQAVQQALQQSTQQAVQQAVQQALQQAAQQDRQCLNVRQASNREDEEEESMVKQHSASVSWEEKEPQKAYHLHEQLLLTKLLPEHALGYSSHGWPHLDAVQDRGHELSACAPRMST